MKTLLAVVLLVTSYLPTQAQDSPERIGSLLVSKNKWVLTKKRSALGGDYEASSGSKMAISFSPDKTGVSEDIDGSGRVIKSVRFTWQLSTTYDKEPVLLVDKVDKVPGRNTDNFISGPSAYGSSLKINVRTVTAKGANDVQLRFTPTAAKYDGTATHYLFN